MIEGIRLSASKLASGYGVPDKLAARIARLASVKVTLTDDVARASASDPALAKLLASARLRSAGKTLTIDRLRRIARSLGVGAAAAGLTVMARRVWRTIAFESEQSELPVLAPVTVLPMKPADLEMLFTAEEVRKLKLVVLTSAEPTEKITAIRRLALAPGPAKEKGAVLLAALSDDAPQVRLEAIKALVPLGLNPDIAREARLLVSGTDKQRIGAAGRLGGLAADAGPGEMSVLLTLIAGTLRTDIPPAERKGLVESLAPAAPVLAEDATQLGAAVALLAEQLAEYPHDLSHPVRQALGALGAREPEGTVDALEAEVQRVPEPAARRFLLGAFASLPVSLERQRPIIQQMIAELLAAAEPETDCLAIANCLCQWGEASADALLDTLRQARRQQKTFILRILDDIATRPSCPARAKKATAGAFLAMLKTDTPTVRAVLLDCELFSDRGLPAPLKADIARELIQHVHEFGSPRMIGAIETTLVKLAAPAIDPLVSLLTEGVRDRERVSAARVLGELVARLTGGKRNGPRVVRALMTCVKLLDTGFPDRDVLAAAIGQMCTSRSMPADTVRRVARGLRVRVGREPYSFGLLDGLGRLASSPNVQLETRVEVAESLLRLLEVDLPEMHSKRFTGGEKTVFIAGNEAAAYTDMIPILLDGLRNVCVHAGSTALRDRLVAALVHKWEEASSWRLVWGPANTLKLAEVLGEMAMAPDAGQEIRTQVTDALVSSSDLLPVLRVLTRLFDTDRDSAQMGRLAAHVARHLLDRMAPASGDRVELDTSVTGCLATVAARKALDGAGQLRPAIAAVLFKALRNDAPGARQALTRMADSTSVARSLRAEIKARLDQT